MAKNTKNKKAISVDDWAVSVGDTLVGPVLERLDAESKDHEDGDIMRLAGHVVTVLVHNMVLDSLSLRRSEVVGRESKELIKDVQEKFAMMKALLESGISIAFEEAMSQAAKQDFVYQCKINRLVAQSSTLPC